mgnify:CR=1 FL=1
MSNSNDWSKLLFKLISVPFLILVLLMVASQVVALHRHVFTKTSAIQRMRLQQNYQVVQPFLDFEENVSISSHTTLVLTL